LKIVIDPLFLRRPKLNYVSPAVCEAIFSGTGSPIIILSDISKLPGPTGLAFGGVGSRRFTWSVYPGALCYNVYTAVFNVHDIFSCQQLVSESATVSYQIIAECLVDPVFVIPSAGCYRVSAITPDGESDLSDPACVCDFTPPPVRVCNDEQTASCEPPLVGTPVTIPAGTFCIDSAPADVPANKSKMNAQALAQANSELSCSGGGTGARFAYYKMDEASGDRADSVGLNPLVEVGPISTQPGIINNGARFRGAPSSGGFASYLHSVSTTAFGFAGSYSMSFWINPPAPGDVGSEPVMIMPSMMMLAVNAGPQLTIFQNIFNPFTSLPNISVDYDVWSHIVWTWDSVTGTAKTYVNGVLATSVSGLAAVATGPGDLRVGSADAGENFQAFEGGIDEMGFWTRVLNPAEVVTLYNGGAALAFGSPSFPA
jgi:hypothetical protein